MVFGICADGFCTEGVVWLASGMGVVLVTMMVVIVLGCAGTLCTGERVVVVSVVLVSLYSQLDRIIVISSSTYIA